MKLLRRNLSLMLAVRYLNPLRTMFSIITLICLGGVALGVMVLIVVLSVMEGLQKEIEDKALAFAPHYVVSLGFGNSPQQATLVQSACDWQGIITKLQKEPDVESVYPRVEGEAFAQSDYARMTIHFTALQPGNESQVAPLREMLKEGRIDFGAGLDEECVISYETSQRLGLNVGDSVHVTPVGNLDEVADAYSLIQKPLMTHEAKDFMEAVTTLFDGVPEDSTESEPAPKEKVEVIFEAMGKFSFKGMRDSEIGLCDTLHRLLATHEEDVPFTPEERKEWRETAQALAALDRDKEDGKTVKNISQMTMPIDLRVVGIYQAPENMGGPNVYMPLPIALNVLGYSKDGDDQVMGICVRVKDIHRETDIVERILAILPEPGAFPAKKTEDSKQGDDAPPPLEDVEFQEGIAEAPAEEAAEGEIIEVEAIPTPDETAQAAAEEGQTETTEAQTAQNAPADVLGAPAPFDWMITPWTESFEKFSKLLANERTMMSFVLSIISLIASFCIMAVMFTMSIQRKREIAVLQALGATPRKIMGIFAWQGLIIGLLGSLLGVALALLVLYYRLEIQTALASIGMDPFPMQSHGISLPAEYNPVTFAQQAFTAFVMVVVAAIIPAFIVAHQDPAKALRSN